MSRPHLNFEDRVKLETYLKQGKSLSQLAAILGFHRSTITREIKRTVPEDIPLSLKRIQYSAKDAQFYSDRRAHSKLGKPTKLKPHMNDFIYDKIKNDKWSPEQIANTVRRRDSVSTHTIYNWIYSGKIPGISEKDLRHKGKRYKRALNKKIRTSLYTTPSDKSRTIQEHNIETRPHTINSRKHFGHWEMDGVESRKSNTILLTFVERKTRFAEVIKVKSKHSDDITSGIQKFLKKFTGCVDSITCDRGSEFISYSTRLLLETNNIRYYYAHAYAPYERGTNENFNGLLREYIPKGTDLSKLTEQQLSKIVMNINTRPMRILRFKSRQTAFTRQFQYRFRHKQNSDKPKICQILKSAI